jgi:hypothetical protein
MVRTPEHLAATAAGLLSHIVNPRASRLFVKPQAYDEGVSAAETKRNLSPL